MSDTPREPEISRDTLVGKLALDRGWITSVQLRDALSELGTGLGPRSLGAILLSRGHLSEFQLGQLLERVGAGEAPAFPPFGKYVLVREIGRGAVGVVYEALETAVQRRVALKMLIATPGRDPEEQRPEQERFLREVELHRGLPPHPGIVPVLDAGIIEGRRYLAMELVEGESMGKWCRLGSVTVRQRVAMLRDVALAVQHAHRHGVIHRDLKPENVLVDRTHQPRITDFGLAKMAGSTVAPLATATGTALGTPAYMSPEQVKGGKDVDHRSDVYALGVMLYEILAGRRPFEGDSAYEIMMKTVNEEAVPPSRAGKLQLNLALYGPLEAICLTALAKERGDRYADAAALAADLTCWLKGEVVRTVPPRPRRGGRARRLLPRLLVGLAALLLLSAAGLALLGRRGSAPEAAPGRRLPAEFQPGAIAELYVGYAFNALALRKIDARVAFDDPAIPLWTVHQEGTTSRRWTGLLEAPAAGLYQFQVASAEFSRLRIDDRDIFLGRGSGSGSAMLGAGPHRFVLEHAHDSALDTVSVSWKTPGASAPTKIGPSSLVHATKDLQLITPPQQSRDFLGPVAGAEEGEALQILQDSGHRPQRAGFGYYGLIWKGAWSGAEHLWWGPDIKPGDHLKLRFAAGEAGRGVLVLSLTRTSDNGIFRIRVNGSVVAEALDLWSPELRVEEFEFRDVPLLAGPNELDFEVVGSNPAASEWSPGSGNYKIGVDYVLVR